MKYLSPYKMFDNVEWQDRYLDKDFPKQELNDLLIPISHLKIKTKVYSYRGIDKIDIFFGNEVEEYVYQNNNKIINSNLIINELELLINFMKSIGYELQWIKLHEIDPSIIKQIDNEHNEFKYSVPYWRDSPNDKYRILDLDELRDKELINYEVQFKA